MNWLTFTSYDGGYMIPADVPAANALEVPARGMVTAVGKSDQRLLEIAPLRPSGWVPPLGAALTRESTKVIDERLHGAARNNEAARVKELLEAGLDPNALNAGRFSPLHRAAWPGHVNVIQPLIDQGADVNVRSGAAASGDLHELRALLAEGVDPNSHGGVLHDAVIGDHLEVVEILLQGGADATIRDPDGYTPLDRARQNNQTSIIDVLQAWPPPVLVQPAP